jgi:hypothetical protein
MAAGGRPGRAAPAGLSHARAHPSKCVAAGCPASFPGSRFDAVKASEAGWFCGKAGSDHPGWHCPEHVPGWVSAWRAKRAAQRHRVSGSAEHLGVVYASGCEETTWPVAPDTDAKALATEIRARAFEHARQTGHQVSVTVSQRLTVTPDD